ncbi:MAG: DUF983 domain-containing protein [Acidimicrobiia bacterium]|nr:DUF983 domain-containing protein [Acidimicrobiia bacterium]
MDWPRPSARTALRRALLLRCPRCGSTGIFTWRLAMTDPCPRCGLVFERTEGYWLGAVTINLMVAMVAVLGVVLGAMVLTWPDVAWTAITVAGAAVGLVVPILFHPHSRMLWIALERQFRSRSEPYA